MFTNEIHTFRTNRGTAYGDKCQSQWWATASRGGKTTIPPASRLITAVTSACCRWSERSETSLHGSHHPSLPLAEWSVSIRIQNKLQMWPPIPFASETISHVGGGRKPFENQKAMTRGRMTCLSVSGHSHSESWTHHSVPTHSPPYIKWTWSGWLPGLMWKRTFACTFCSRRNDLSSDFRGLRTPGSGSSAAPSRDARRFWARGRVGWTDRSTRHCAASGGGTSHQFPDGWKEKTDFFLCSIAKGSNQTNLTSSLNCCWTFNSKCSTNTSSSH